MKSEIRAILLIIMLLTSLILCTACGGTGDGDVGGEENGGGEVDTKPVGEIDLEGLGEGKIKDAVTDKYGYKLSSLGNDYMFTEIVKEEGEHLLKIQKGEAPSALTFTLKPPKTEGEWFGFGATVLIDSFDKGDVAFELSLGKMYTLKFALGAYSILVYDVNTDRYENMLTNVIEVGESFDIYVEFTNGDETVFDDDGELISTKMQANVYINGEYIANSKNFYSIYNLNSTDFGDITITIPRDTEATVKMSNIKAVKTEAKKDTGSPEISVGIADKYTEWRDRYRIFADVIGEAGAKQLIESSENLFGTEVYEWLAALYDPDSGIFYYSNSARDNFGYLPSIDNLGQGLSILVSLGVAEKVTDILTDEHKARVTAWAQLYHSGRDGYFYHPHWGSAISDSRRGRDLTSFGALITNYGGGEFLFNDANYRLSGGSTGNVGKVLPTPYALAPTAEEAATRVVKSVSKVSSVGYFDSESTLVSYLDGLWTRYNGDSYQTGSTIASQASQIKAAGLGKTCIDWLNAKQKAVQDALAAEGKKPNGIWESQVNYRTISGLLKISGVYNTLGYKFNYADSALESSIEVMVAGIEDYNPDTSGIVYVYNPPRAIENIIININSGYNDDSALALRVRDILRDNSKDIIKVTEQKLMLYRKADGSFSYYPSHSSETSQNSPAAVPGTNEGDVNATSLAFGTRTALFSIFGLKIQPVLSPDPNDSLFDMDGDGVKETVGHLERFRKLIGAVDHIEKTDSRYNEGTYLFRDTDALPTVDSNYSKYGTLSKKDGILTVTDSSSDGGYVVYFNTGLIEDEESKVFFKATMRYTEAPKETTPHQLFMDGLLKLDFKTMSGRLYFVNKYKLGTSSTEYDEKIKTGTAGGTVTVDPTEFFTIQLEVFYDGIVVDGKTYYVRTTVTQGDSTAVGYLEHARVEDISTLGYTHTRLFSLKSTVGSVEYKDVYSKSTDKISGDYTFERSDDMPGGIEGGSIIVGKNNSLDTLGGKVSLTGANVSGAYNYNEAQLDMTLSGSASGEIALTDRSGRAILGLVYTYADGKLTVIHAKSGQQLLSVDADISKAITVRLEYHHDMSAPTLYLYLRYTDSTSGYLETEAAQLTNMTTSDAAAVAADFYKLTVEPGTGGAVLDNVIVKNRTK